MDLPGVANKNMVEMIMESRKKSTYGWYKINKKMRSKFTESYRCKNKKVRNREDRIMQ